jgi:NADH-quinone oxidoreductase subunit M
MTLDLAGTPILSVITFLPLVGVLFIAFLPKGADGNARWAALWVTLFTFIVSLVIWIDFDHTTAEFQFVEECRGSGRSNTKWALTAFRCCSSS